MTWVSSLYCCIHNTKPKILFTFLLLHLPFFSPDDLIHTPRHTPFNYMTFGWLYAVINPFCVFIYYKIVYSNLLKDVMVNISKYCRLKGHRQASLTLIDGFIVFSCICFGFCCRLYQIPQPSSVCTTPWMDLVSMSFQWGYSLWTRKMGLYMC